MHLAAAGKAAKCTTGLWAADAAVVKEMWKRCLVTHGRYGGVYRLTLEPQLTTPSNAFIERIVAASLPDRFYLL